MKAYFSAVLLVLSLFVARAADPTLMIDAGKGVGTTSPTLYGLMTEEISHSYDGGLYAELVRNRSFLDDPDKPAHWSVVQGYGAMASISLDTSNPLNQQLKTSLKLVVTTASANAPARVANEGYWGVPVKSETQYHASFYAKAAPGFSGTVQVAIVGTNATVIYASAKVRRLTTEWQHYELKLNTGLVNATSAARLVLLVDQPGTIWFDLVSLFPPTWKNRSNGLRPDLMQMLVDLKPSFLRFPGGNYLEGDQIETRFDWKKTIGPLSQRPGHQGPWGYRSSDGLGLLEFLIWAEEMGAVPVLAVYAGYSLKGAYVASGPALQPFIQDALDEIEYVSGPTYTRWGAQRARDGHTAPFPLHYVEIGNEDFFDRSGSYDGRFAQFRDAIKARYPQIQCISTVGNEQPESKRVHSRRPDLLDEHYYRSASTFLKEAPDQFERYDRKGPRIFVGEWAAYEDIVPWAPESRRLPPTPSMKSALGDAAWMMAMERNSDLILMQCYAPLLVNVNPGARQWRPNMIGYDALHVFGSPSYYAFQMFSRNSGDEILKASLDSSPVQYSATRDTKRGEIIIKFVNPQSLPQPIHFELRGIHSLQPEGTLIMLTAASEASNSIDHPGDVLPAISQFPCPQPTFNYTLPANSIGVLRLKAR
jgi:alpha-N-arabinofuranosidase